MAYCKFCGQEIAANSKRRKVYCSQWCANQSAAAVRETKTDAARREIMEHYGSECAECGATESLHLHHAAGDGVHERRTLKPYGWIQQRDRLASLGWPDGYIETLCAECHAKTHRESPALLKIALRIISEECSDRLSEVTLDKDGPDA